MWVFTVASLRCSDLAISALNRPRATCLRASTYRSVSRSSDSGMRAPGFGRDTNRSSSRVIADATSASPAATTRTAWTGSAGATSSAGTPGAIRGRFGDVLVKVEGRPVQQQKPLLTESV